MQGFFRLSTTARGALRRPAAACIAAVMLVGFDPIVLSYAQTWIPPLTLQDPQLLFSTTFGRGNGQVRKVAIDADGSIIIAGWTQERFSFPLVNAADSTFGDEGQEGFVAKISPSRDNLVYSTYLGGNGDDWVSGLTLDAGGNAYVVGTTVSLDFPTLNGLQPLANVDASNNVRDGFVAKLGPTGNLIWATYLGGDASDEAHSVVVDSDSAVYVVGSTGSIDFPSQNAFQPSCALSEVTQRCADAFVTKLAADGASLMFSTYLGGSLGGQDEEACDVGIDGFGNVYVIGEVRSDDFPILGAIQSMRGGGNSDMFITKFSAAGDSLIWSTFLGGNEHDGFCSVLAGGVSIAVDSQGDAYVATFARSTDLPIVGGFQPTHKGADDGYVAKITSGGMLAWSTYLGGTGSDSPQDIALSDSGTPVVAGWTQSKDFPLTADALTEIGCPDAGTPFCPFDAFVTVLGAGDGSLSFSTFLGAEDSEQAAGVAVGADDMIYLAGSTRSGFFPMVDPLPAEYRGSGTLEPFVSVIASAPEAMPGDANGDGAITASDALIALNAAIAAAVCELCICDLNGDGSVTATDALILLNLAVGLPVNINPPPC